MLNGWMCVHACIGLVEMEWERAAEKLMLERVNVRGVEENEGIPDSPCQTPQSRLEGWCWGETGI